MIDFRYHLVSLISVFLALAVGVVLGAGPLQSSLGNALNDQVASLREDRNATQGKLEQTETAVNDRRGGCLPARHPDRPQGRARRPA